MYSTSIHLNWLVDSGNTLLSASGLPVQVLEFQHTDDDEILSAWARHFRNNYCLDELVDDLRSGTGFSRAEYLTNRIFPCQVTPPGPSTRAGDFAEILIADYVEFHLGYWVPRVRWQSKVIRNESVKGCDVVGFQYDGENDAPTDEMFVLESKARFTGQTSTHLQEAINHSAKDERRIGETLNFLKRRFQERGNKAREHFIERFQNPHDRPYQDKFAAAAFVLSDDFDDAIITTADATMVPSDNGFVPHPGIDSLTLYVFKGSDLMALVHGLYGRAADEA